MKKIIIFLISLLLVLNSTFFITFSAFTDSFPIECDIGYIMSADNNQSVIYDKNSKKKADPGEIVKIVTGIIVIENCANLEETVTASESAIHYVEQNRCTTAGILVNEVISVKELLYCLLLYNAGDAASVLAEYISGSRDVFVEEMNSFAEKLGLDNTNFTNPIGLNEPNQYSTAEDIAKIFNYCMNNTVFSEIISTFLYEMPATNKYKSTRYLKNTNALIDYTSNSYYSKDVKAGKSGYTAEKLTNCVSLASKDGYNYICVILNAPKVNANEGGKSDNMSFKLSRDLFNWVFENIKLRVVANPSTYVCEAQVRFSKDFDYVSLVPEKTVNALVPPSVNNNSVYIEPIPDQTKSVVDAPIKKGDVVGRAAIKYAGETVAEVNLVADFDVNRSVPKYIGFKILEFIKNPIFILSFLGIVLLTLIICFLSYRKRQREIIKRKRKLNERGN